jgi:hypothetical protein
MTRMETATSAPRAAPPSPNQPRSPWRKTTLGLRAIIAVQVAALLLATGIGVKSQWDHRHDPLPPTLAGAKKILGLLQPVCEGDGVIQAGSREPGERRRALYLNTDSPTDPREPIDPHQSLKSYDTVICVSSALEAAGSCEFNAAEVHRPANPGDPQIPDRNVSISYSSASRVVQVSVRDATTGDEIGRNEFKVPPPPCRTTESFAGPSDVPEGLEGPPFSEAIAELAVASVERFLVA